MLVEEYGKAKRYERRELKFWREKFVEVRTFIYIIDLLKSSIE